MQLNGKKVELKQLDSELTAAGVAHNGLYGDVVQVLTYTAAGVVCEFSNLAAAQSVLASHVPASPTIVAALQHGDADAATRRDVLAQVAAAQQAPTLQSLADALAAVANYTIPPAP